MKVYSSKYCVRTMHLTFSSYKPSYCKHFMVKISLSIDDINQAKYYVLMVYLETDKR